MNNSILAFSHNSNEDRTLRIEKSLKNSSIISNEDMSAAITVRFDSAKIEFDDETKRPYIMFRDGEVRSVKGQFPYGIQNIRFQAGHRPPVEVRWELSNEEINELVSKGLYGYGPNEPKAKAELETPDIFIDADFENIPVKTDVYATEYVNDDGKKIPIISCTIKEPYSCVTNSEETGYGNIASYFDKAKQELAPKTNRQAMKEIPENELWGYVPEAEDDMVVRPEKVLSKEEEKENMLRAMLAAEITTRRDEHITKSDIDFIVTDTQSAVDELFEEDGQEPDVAADEAMTDSELADLHLTPKNDDDHKKAKQKIAEQAIRKAGGVQTMQEQQEKYVAGQYSDEDIQSSHDDGMSL